MKHFYLPKKNEYHKLFVTLAPENEIDNIKAWSCMGNCSCTCTSCNSCTCSRCDSCSCRNSSSKIEADSHILPIWEKIK